MKKIPTIYDRDWQGNRGVIDKLVVDFDFDYAIAAEKLDGTNVRLTARNHVLVRLEKRHNPTKAQKAVGIVDPWYVDADENNLEDKYIWEAARNTFLSEIENGEWIGEAVGPKIQSNPLWLTAREVVLFSLPSVLEDLRKYPPDPCDFEAMREWLQNEKSNLGDELIEGIVWHEIDHTSCEPQMVKIKTKDFK